MKKCMVHKIFKYGALVGEVLIYLEDEVVIGVGIGHLNMGDIPPGIEIDEEGGYHEGEDIKL